jgi:Domain of unknown function (DUF5658)
LISFYAVCCDVNRESTPPDLLLDGKFDPKRARINQLFLNCAYLQVLDFLTTIAFLLHGVKEANPLVVFFVRLAGNPVGGILAAKILGVLIASYCWRHKRVRTLGRINLFFAFLVTWNLVALILGSV